MRALLTTAIALGMVGMSGLSAGAEAGRESVYRGKCGTRVLPKAPHGLPADVMIWTDCGVFVVHTGGVVSHERQLSRGRWFQSAAGEERPLDLPPPKMRPRRVAEYSGFVRKPVGSGVAFTVTDGYAGYMEPGYETVYLLERGRRPRTLLRHRLRFTLCGRGVQLSWRRSWLLYGAGEGYAVAFDTTSGTRIDLTKTLRALPGTWATSHGYRVMSVVWA